MGFFEGKGKGKNGGGCAENKLTCFKNHVQYTLAGPNPGESMLVTVRNDNIYGSVTSGCPGVGPKHRPAHLSSD